MQCWRGWSQARAPTATSSASVAVGGEPRAVVLYALDDSTVIAFVLDPVACEIVDSVELNPGG